MIAKFKKGDKVQFLGPKGAKLVGTIYICDARSKSEKEFYGDWFTYDIWAQECLFKHVPECNIKLSPK